MYLCYYPEILQLYTSTKEPKTDAVLWYHIMVVAGRVSFSFPNSIRVGNGCLIA